MNVAIKLDGRVKNDGCYQTSW